MKKQEFFSLLANEFNLDGNTINETTVLTDIPDWDSMSILIVMSIIDEHFGISISADDFIKINSIGDILSIVGSKHID